MPVYQLSEAIAFPHPSLATDEGVLAVGGDLSPERLLLAYANGIFPWYSHGDPIIWWSPDPRFVLFPGELLVSKTMRQVLRRNVFTITFDRAFRAVIASCKKIRRRRERGTWITGEMLEAYVRLHELGYAHSAEAWRDDELVGGLYGVSLGRCFFGESMFSRESNASKAALITLTRRLAARGFGLVDCQVHTDHLESLGARVIPRDEFLVTLRGLVGADTLRGDWGALMPVEDR